MSFGGRLRLFFIGIVAVPMVVLAVLVVLVSRDSREGKADARLAAGLETARTVYDEALRSAPDQAKRIARRVGPELASGDRSALSAAAARAAADPAITSVTFTAASGRVLASAGPPGAIARGESVVRSCNGEGKVGTVRVATLSARTFTARVRKLTGRNAALVTDRKVLASTTRLGDAVTPTDPGAGATDVDLPGDGRFRAAALALNGAPTGARLVVIAPVESGLVASEPLVAVALAVFFAIAFLLIALLLRNLQRRIAGMLEAARRIGEGDFEGQVPVEGDDEMAGLARELNRMSERLRTQMDALQRQRHELDESVTRIGEAFASGLDRRALLEIVADTAVTACDAEGGRVALRDPSDTLETDGSPRELAATLQAAGEAARRARGAGESVDDQAGHHAIAHAIVDREDGDVLCTLAVARKGRRFSADEREVLRYLIGQTATSIENIDLHERVSEQALTDGLTGIPNHRRFSEWLEHEVARVERFGGELSLVLLDIDNFKEVNDSYGHQDGDRVLERIGRILAEESREVDIAARYGGEEFVLALTATSHEGAVEAAERVRTKIEASAVERSEGSDAFSVTASLGVSTLPGDGSDARSLVAAADRALYRAKRAGKNRVVATTNGSPAQGNGSDRRI